MMGGRVVHCKREPYDTYIGRPGPWGNPFSHLPGSASGHFLVATREEAIERYETWLRCQPHLLDDIHMLDGRVLGCWCKPKHACHGDVLLRLIEELRVPQT